eukprot:gnl/TRDRNA2_/TRDRNA2_37871_c0_seq1.p1 gnl/TRDRNA2_/TRDRNA2_37871_c0~~gnl/TRDRNA2_/TRDRNA2_37871_c0_seq1.p1  ORF type:complete len:688 (-),score=107.52 gnl/TRDRNA2_/TRDRNA2_37871_c0_seq1:140-2203(-)
MSAKNGDNSTHALRQVMTFVDCTVKDIQDAVATETTDWTPHSHFWTQVLLNQVSADFKQLENQTLSFWMKFYNSWQALNGYGAEAPDTVDGNFLIQSLKLSKHYLSTLVALFDPNSAKRFQAQGITQRSLSHVAVHPVEVITAGVILSKLITTEHKISVMLGLFDLQDSGSLDELQFGDFINTFVRGISAAFGIPNAVASGTPQRVADLFFKRISVQSAKRIKAAYMEVSGSDQKAAVVQLVRERQKASKNEAGRAPRDKGTGGNSRVNGRQRIPFCTLSEWLTGDHSDPLALPFSLLLARFSSARRGGFTDEFVGDKCFRLSHREPIAIPDEGTRKDGPAFQSITQREVLFAREVFRLLPKFCSDGLVRSPGYDFLSECSCAAARKFGVDDREQQRVYEAFLQVTEDFRFQAYQSVDFYDLLRKLCPVGHPKHLRMFESWCITYDNVVNKQEGLEEALGTFQENESKPVIPGDEIANLKREFRRFDRRGSGSVDTYDVALEYQMPAEVLARFSSTGDGYIDEDAFVAMMCPAEYRIPQMAGESRDCFGALLEFELQKVRRGVAEYHDAAGVKQKRRRPSLTDDKRQSSLERPELTYPIVEDEKWHQWNAIFDRLDTDGDNKVSSTNLENSGIVSATVSSYITSIIDPTCEHTFTREGFLAAMLESHKVRRPSFTADMWIKNQAMAA